jgi:hypothetical protein
LFIILHSAPMCLACYMPRADPVVMSVISTHDKEPVVELSLAVQ